MLHYNPYTTATIAFKVSLKIKYLMLLGKKYDNAGRHCWYFKILLSLSTWYYNCQKQRKSWISNFSISELKCSFLMVNQWKW